MKTAPLTIRQKEANKVVRRGARLLDRLVPDWHTKINLNSLSLGSCHDCICGQLASKAYRSLRIERNTTGWISWITGRRALAKLAIDAGLKIEFYDGDEKDLHPKKYGFLMTSKFSYKQLDIAWRNEVEKRLANKV